MISNSSLHYEATETSRNLEKINREVGFLRNSVHNVKGTQLFTCSGFRSKSGCQLHTSRRWNKERVYFLLDSNDQLNVIPFHFGAAVYTGPGPVKDVFSTTNTMTVLFITNNLLAKGGFKANFTTGYHLGIPGKCTRDYMVHCNFWSKMIKAYSISRIEYDVEIYILVHSFVLILLKIFFLPLPFCNHWLSRFKTGIPTIFSGCTCPSLFL